MRIEKKTLKDKRHHSLKLRHKIGIKIMLKKKQMRSAVSSISPCLVVTSLRRCLDFMID
jgi:hypothetical protein